MQTNERQTIRSEFRKARETFQGKNPSGSSTRKKDKRSIHDELVVGLICDLRLCALISPVQRHRRPIDAATFTRRRLERLRAETQIECRHSGRGSRRLATSAKLLFETVLSLRVLMVRRLKADPVASAGAPAATEAAKYEIGRGRRIGVATLSPAGTRTPPRILHPGRGSIGKP